MYTCHEVHTAPNVIKAQQLAKRIGERDSIPINSQVPWFGGFIYQFANTSPKYQQVFHDEMNKSIRKVSDALDILEDIKLKKTFETPFLHMFCKPDKEGTHTDNGAVSYIFPITLESARGDLEVVISSGIYMDFVGEEFRYALSVRDSVTKKSEAPFILRFKEEKNIGGRTIPNPNEDRLKQEIYNTLNRIQIYQHLSRRLKLMKHKK